MPKPQTPKANTAARMPSTPAMTSGKSHHRHLLCPNTAAAAGPAPILESARCPRDQVVSSRAHAPMRHSRQTADGHTCSVKFPCRTLWLQHHSNMLAIAPSMLLVIEAHVRCQNRQYRDSDLLECIQVWLVECCLKVGAGVCKSIPLLADEEAEHLHHWHLCVNTAGCVYTAYSAGPIIRSPTFASAA